VLRRVTARFVGVGIRPEHVKPAAPKARRRRPGQRSIA
jgi:hypothetical protein